MDKKLTKCTKTWSPQNMHTYPTLQTIIDNAIKHKHTLNSPEFISNEYWSGSFYALIGIHY